ncbi:MAG: hypothetical protein ACXAD7_24920 [Candidatus Kariarchaeaceae archaeon]|jgi:menaquinone-dependent protoporphyrinogen IX oxidase
MRAWIVHDSKFGNGELVAKTLARAINGDVTIGHNRKISPRSVVETSPDVLIIGNAIRMFRMSSSTKRWLKKLNKLMIKKKQRVRYGMCYVTHAREVEKIERHVIKFHDHLSTLDSISNVFPNYILAQVQDIEGPLKEGVLDYITNVGEELLEWIKQIEQKRSVEILL